MHPVSGARPESPFRVEAEAVEEASRAGREHLPAGGAAVIADGELPDVARAVRHVGRPGVGVIEVPLVWREGEPVRADEVIGDHPQLAGNGIDAIDITRAALTLRLVSLVVG